MKRPKRALIFINSKKKEARDLGREVKIALSSLKIASDFFTPKGKPDFHVEKGFDMAICLGGDGTVLAAARAVSPLGIPIFPVNFGTFGFIAGIKPEEWRDKLKTYLNGKLCLSSRLMLGIRVEREGREVLNGSCLNDIVISALGIAKIINLKVSYFSPKEVLPLGSYRSDGLIVATPTGSTAYSAASGGPIVDPELEAMIINPICPFVLYSRPMVLPAAETVQVDVEKEQRSGVLLTVDGQVTARLKGGDKVYLRKAPYNCRLVDSGREDFYNTLKKKFLMTTDV